MRRRLHLAPFCGLFVTSTHGRSIFLDETTKGTSAAKHLDLYARRDPQLAPYLLREVDIEFKRRCRKVNFVFWVALLTGLLLYDERIALESMHYLKKYAEQAKLEEHARDDDTNERRAKLVEVMNVVKDAFERDQRWSKADAEKAKKVLQ